MSGENGRSHPPVGGDNEKAAYFGVSPTILVDQTRFYSLLCRPRQTAFLIQ